MIRNINIMSLTILSLSIALASCKNDSKFNDMRQTENQGKHTLKENTKTIVDSLFEQQINKGVFNKKDFNYQVHGTDEDGNKVFGTINIEGKVGIGMIHGNEEKAIEIVVEWTGKDRFTAIDLNGYQYKLVVDSK